MIAQVWASKAPAGPMSDEARKFTEEALSEGRRRDGVEGIVAITDPATGESLSIVLFRDQTALDAYQAFSEEKIIDVGELGEEVAASRVYSEVIAAL